MAISVVSFSFSWCSTGGPGAHSADFLYCILSPTGLVPKLHRGSRGPLRPGMLTFPTTTCLQLVWSPTRLTPVSTELYNSSIAHSIFGMACLIVIKRKQLSCSSEVTLFRCISLRVYNGLLPIPFRQPNPSTRFLSITGHWNVSLPSSPSLWNGMFGRVEGQYTTMYYKRVTELNSLDEKVS